MMTIQIRYFDGRSEVAEAMQAWQLSISCQINPTLATMLIREYGYPIALEAAKASTRGHSAMEIASVLRNDDCPSGIREAIAAWPDPKLVELTAIKFEACGQDFDWWVCDPDGVVLESIVFQTPVWAGCRVTNLIGLVLGNPVNFEWKDDSGYKRTLKYNVVSIVKSTKTES
jgi:hypothetical protein